MSQKILQFPQKTVDSVHKKKMALGCQHLFWKDRGKLVSTLLENKENT